MTTNFIVPEKNKSFWSEFSAPFLLTIFAAMTMVVIAVVASSHYSKHTIHYLALIVPATNVFLGMRFDHLSLGMEKSKSWIKQTAVLFNILMLLSTTFYLWLVLF